MLQERAQLTGRAELNLRTSAKHFERMAELAAECESAQGHMINRDGQSLHVHAVINRATLFVHGLGLGLGLGKWIKLIQGVGAFGERLVSFVNEEQAAQDRYLEAVK